jgi:asparaginyl-tRNA synthetase
MSPITTSSLAAHVGQDITIQGWLYNKRSSGPIAFLEVRDGYGWRSVVAAKESLAPEVWAEVEKVSQESSVKLVGTVTKHPKREGVFEIQLKEFKVLQLAVDYPIAKKDHGPDFLLENRHLWLRSKRQWAILRLRDRIMMAMQEYLHKEAFMTARK